jgi:lysine 2,3-aminomutase
VFLPMRVTTELCDVLQRFHPLWLNIHVNHSN